MIVLTEREWQIGQLVMKGLSNRQIGLHLTLSPLTVKNHMFKMFRRTETLNRKELAVLLATHPVTIGDGRRNHGANHIPPDCHAEVEYQSWSNIFNLTLTIKPQSAGEEEYISWYYLAHA
jgi:DNA-binding CsgD family transcriptional regulator